MSARPIVGLGARLTKLRAMPWREITGRVRYRAALSVERARYRRGRLSSPGTLERALAPAFQGPAWKQRLLDARAGSAGRFLAGTRDREAMQRLFSTDYRRELDDTLAHAREAREHRFAFFGHQFAYGPDIDWQMDPVTKRRWPQTFHADVPVHRGNVGFGDVKHVWELSRQQYLVDLGKSWFLTRNDADLKALERLVRSWISGNPYGTGVNWACALEPAFRSISWLWAYHLTVDALDEDVHVEWLAALHDHGRFIARHLEHYSSPYNHLIGEATALYMLGASLPEFRDSATWRSIARTVLVGRLAEQFYADGGSVEQSTFYHHATVGDYLLAALMARAIGDDLPEEIWRAIERGIAFSADLMQPDGRTPEIGGADDGKPIRMEHLQFWDFRPYQAIGAVLFSRADFKTLAGRFFEDALWLLGPGGREQFEAMPAAAPARTSRALPSSGYRVLRSNWTERAHYVCFDCGEQAAGIRTDAIPNSMHGHADCLSVVVWLDGRRVLVDSGFYAYNCGDAWESHFRETAAHNTARVDGRDQARHIGKMAWSHGYRATVEGEHVDAPGGWVIGSHDGYARGSNGLTHRRAVWLRQDGYVAIYDEIVGEGAHDVEVNYQFAPGLLEIAGDGRATFAQDIEIAWTGSGTWHAFVRTGGAGPDEGWISTSLGVREAAPRLTLSTQSAEPRRWLLVIAAAAPRAVLRPQAGANAGQPLGVSWPDHTDWIVAGAAGSDGPIATDGLIGITRVRREDLDVESAHAGGTWLRADADALRSFEMRALTPSGSERRTRS